MPQRKDLPFLLALLDDDTPTVQAGVVTALKAFGPRLEGLSRPHRAQLDERQRMQLESILAQLDSERLANSWLGWLELEDFHHALEQAMICLSEGEYGPQARQLGVWLDELADQFDATHRSGRDSVALMQFLFADQGFRCVSESQQTYQHEFLYHLATHHQGSPNALTCLALLVGGRVGIDMHGIIIRGHFMSMACQDTNLQMYNAYDGGKPLSRSSALYMEEALRRNCTWPSEMRAPVFEIVSRMLVQTIDRLKQKRTFALAFRYQGYQRELQQELQRRGLLTNE
jgi:regulator of sirC expression with transglutaminase-like and TPR domain